MGTNKIATVYIDGFNLYHGLVSKGWSMYKWLDLCSISKQIIPAGYELGRVWYFTSRIKGDKPKYERQQQFISALKVHNGDGIEIRYGNYQFFDSHCKHCQSKPVFCENCKKEYKKPTEKKTDVNLSTAMLTDCFEKLTDCIVLVSGDSDYEAPLKEVKRLFPNVLRRVAYPPRRKNNSLANLCDDSLEIEEAVFQDCQLPNPVISKRTGKKYTKPSDWT